MCFAVFTSLSLAQRAFSFWGQFAHIKVLRYWALADTQNAVGRRTNVVSQRHRCVVLEATGCLLLGRQDIANAARALAYMATAVDVVVD